MDPLTRPIFIVAPPQSGTGYLFELLGRSPGIRKLEESGRAVFDFAEELNPAARGHDSNRRTAEDATPEAAERLRAELRGSLGEQEDGLVSDPPPRLLDATPRNALRVPFLDAVFPDAVFIYLYRDPRETLPGMVEAWESGAYVTYPRLPGWPEPRWSMLLVPGWRELAGRPVAEIAGEQWSITTRTLLDDLERLPPERWSVVDFRALVAKPRHVMRGLCEYLAVEPVDTAAGNPNAHVLAPTRKTQEEHSERLQEVLAATTGLAERARDLIAAPVSPRPTATPDGESALRSVYTASMPRILSRIGGSLLLSTLDSGRLVCVRHDGVRINTHFRSVSRPAGIAASADRIAVAGRGQVLEFRNSPAAVQRLATPGAHDACYLPRTCHYVGDLDAHALAFAGEETWLAAPRYDCLATIGPGSAIVPRWQPPFVTELAAGDRCHLSGLAAAGGELAFATALGRSDTPGGWREEREHGGCVIDVRASRVLAEGLALPHSPRWHQGRLWLLESGRGTLAVLDPRSGELETVAALPGFTRGLALAGLVAFVGVSKPREGAELELAEPAAEPSCGIWAVDLEHGATLGFLRFEEQIAEIFDVAHLPWHRFPEIAAPGSDTALGEVELAPELRGFAPLAGGNG